MSIKLILICKEGEARQAYLAEAKKIGIEVDVVSSYGELFKNMIGNPYQGIMVDMITSMKSPKEDKGTAQDAIEAFPIVQLRWDGESKTINTISLGKGFASGSLADFVAKECANFTARAIRLNPRKPINFNVIMSKEEAMNKTAIERTVTVNVSKGGCFFYTVQDWSDTKEVHFIIKELHDRTPISGEIRWAVQWGKTMMLPGIGISFLSISPKQLEELASKYSI